jgi:lipopolysaccharide/colanic/teichoic acid biosynthesis glycosyltransferase
MAKPGLTGLWQVTARSSADFDEMVRMDIWYYEHQSLWLDIRIFLKTPLSVLSMEGAV